MIINKEKYLLTSNNYYESEYKKTQIVLGNSFSETDKHIIGWNNRIGGVYKKTSTFSILKTGEIYQHFDDVYYSDFLDSKTLNKKIITITLENRGWLQKDLEQNIYFDWVGNIYNDKENIIEKKWRGQTYWDYYTIEQYVSTNNLINFICEKHKIPKKCVGHNTYIEDIDIFEGITYKSNYYKDCTDLNPGWNFKKFKETFEDEKINY
jgi:hypothetical protein